MPAVTPRERPVAVTGASGYVGSHVTIALMKRGYTVRACITDPSNPDKTNFLKALNDEYPGNLTLHQANLLDDGSYDDAFAGCSAVLHVGTAMGYGGVNNPQQVYDGAVDGTNNILNSIKKSGTVKRLIYTSSFAAISHPAKSGYVFTEADWASDNREGDPNWSTDNLVDKGEVGYAMAKVACEHLVNETAEKDGSFDAISVCPLAVLGPLLSPIHELPGSWQWAVGYMLAGRNCPRGWNHLWNCVDVRDVAESQALMLESHVCKNGDRYQLTATDEKGELSVKDLQNHLQALFPEIEVGGPPPAYDDIIEKHGHVYQAPIARCDKARNELGLKTHAIEDTLRATGETMLALGLIKR